MTSSLELRRPRAKQARARRLFSLLLSLTTPSVCSALEIHSVQTCSGEVLHLRGAIKEGDYSRLQSRLAGSRAVAGLDISSEGGIFEEGRRIATLVRRERLTVFVAGVCYSACADVFLAATQRYFGAGSKIGVHSVSNSDQLEDAASKKLTAKVATLWAAMGVPEAAIFKMVSTRPASITYLDRSDLASLGAIESNPFQNEGSHRKPPVLGEACAAGRPSNRGLVRMAR
jgi:hypothetical protein